MGRGMKRTWRERERERERGWLLTVDPSAKVLSLVGSFQHEESLRNVHVYSLPT
jgi:hypothetical protein